MNAQHRRYLRFHFFYDALRFIGMRDRLRCPSCSAVGTWKPHGGILDVEDERKVKRWLCKWCGFYLGPEGKLQCGIGFQSWELPDNPNLIRIVTPLSAVRDSFKSDIDPWRG